MDTEELRKENIRLYEAIERKSAVIAEQMAAISKIGGELAEARTLITTLRGMLTTHVAQLEEMNRQAYADKLRIEQLGQALADGQRRMGAVLLEKADLEHQKVGLVAALNDLAEGHSASRVQRAKQALADAGVVL